MHEKLIAYTVVERERDGQKFWVRIGDAFPNRQGDEIEIKLDAVPVNGRIVLRGARRGLDGLLPRAGDLEQVMEGLDDEEKLSGDVGETEIASRIVDAVLSRLSIRGWVSTPSDRPDLVSLVARELAKEAVDVSPFLDALAQAIEAAARRRTTLMEALPWLDPSARETLNNGVGRSPLLADIIGRVGQAIGDLARSAQGRARVVAPERVATLRTQLGSIRACLDDITDVGSTEGKEHRRDMLHSAVSHLESTFASTFPEGDEKPAAVKLPRPKIRAKLSATLASFFLRQLEELGPEKLRQMHRGDFALMIERILVEHGRG